MIEISMIRDLVAIFGVIAGFSYYVLTVRNQNISKKTQDFMRIYEHFSSKQTFSDWWIQLDSHWEDYDDFEKKYGSDNNPDFASVRFTSWNYYEGIGVLLRKGMIELDLTYRLLGVYTLMHWFKWETIIKKMRRSFVGSDFLENFEYLADEMIRMRKKDNKSMPVELLHPTSKLIEEHI